MSASAPQPIRLIARVIGNLLRPPVHHYRGSPPQIAEGDTRERLPWPAIVVLEEEPDGFFLYRFTQSGEYAGDTWHRTQDEAKEQARYEFGQLLTEWLAVPSEVQDAAEYGLSLHSSKYIWNLLVACPSLASRLHLSEGENFVLGQVGLMLRDGDLNGDEERCVYEYLNGMAHSDEDAQNLLIVNVLEVLTDTEEAVKRARASLTGHASFLFERVIRGWVIRKR